MISQPRVTVYCDTDGCGYSDDFELTTTARGYDERDLSSEMRGYGWVTISDNEHMCPQCAEQQAAAPDSASEDRGR